MKRPNDSSETKHKSSYDDLKACGDILGREVLKLFINGMVNEPLLKAYENWRDASIGKPNWGTTCSKQEKY